MREAAFLDLRNSGRRGVHAGRMVRERRVVLRDWILNMGRPINLEDDKALKENTSMSEIRDTNWKEIAKRFREQNAGLRVAHVFGEVGRLLGCRLFMVAIPPSMNVRGAGYQALSRDLRDELRRHFTAYQSANARTGPNAKSQSECAYKACPHREECPGGRRSDVRMSDVEANRKKWFGGKG
jgi:hypothetical protein